MLLYTQRELISLVPIVYAPTEAEQDLQLYAMELYTPGFHKWLWQYSTYAQETYPSAEEVIEDVKRSLLNINDQDYAALEFVIQSISNLFQTGKTPDEIKESVLEGYNFYVQQIGKNSDITKQEGIVKEEIEEPINTDEITEEENVEEVTSQKQATDSLFTKSTSFNSVISTKIKPLASSNAIAESTSKNSKIPDFSVQSFHSGSANFMSEENQDEVKKQAKNIQLGIQIAIAVIFTIILFFASR